MSIRDLILFPDGPNPKEFTPNMILVFDLENMEISAAVRFLEEYANTSKATILVAATGEQFAREPFAKVVEALDSVDAVLVEKPAGLHGEDLRQLLYSSLTKFQSSRAQGEPPSKPAPESSEIDPVYFEPRFAFTERQRHELMQYLQASESEVRREAYPRIPVR